MRKNHVIVLLIALIMLLIGSAAAEKNSLKCVNPKNVDLHQVEAVLQPNAIDAAEKVYISNSGVSVKVPAGFVQDRSYGSAWINWIGTMESGATGTFGYRRQSNFLPSNRFKGS